MSIELNELTPQELSAMYAECGAINALARQLGRPYPTVRARLIKLGIEIKTRGYDSPKHITHKAADHHNWKGGLCMTDKGYVIEYAPDHPDAASRKGYVLQHRLVMERVLGRRLLPSEVVHHINGNKTDNRPDNLELMKRGRHISMHKRVALRTKRGRFAKSLS
jgi:hypothetical protein